MTTKALTSTLDRCYQPLSRAMLQKVNENALRVPEHRAVLLALALRLTASGSDAEDLVQDTLERGLKNAHKLRSNSNFRAWLVTILHNRFIDDCRRRKRRSEVEQVEPDELPAEQSEREPIWSQIKPADLERAVAKIPSAFRRVFELHAFERRSYDEIAEILEIEKSTVGSRLHRARSKIKAVLLKKVDPGDIGSEPGQQCKIQSRNQSHG